LGALTHSKIQLITQANDDDDNDDICCVDVCIIESYVNAFISRIFISNDDGYNTLYSTTMTTIWLYQMKVIGTTCL